MVLGYTPGAAFDSAAFAAQSSAAAVAFLAMTFVAFGTSLVLPFLDVACVAEVVSYPAAFPCYKTVEAAGSHSIPDVADFHSRHDQRDLPS